MFARRNAMYHAVRGPACIDQTRQERDKATHTVTLLKVRVGNGGRQMRKRKQIARERDARVEGIGQRLAALDAVVQRSVDKRP